MEMAIVFIIVVFLKKEGKKTEKRKQRKEKGM